MNDVVRSGAGSAGAAAVDGSGEASAAEREVRRVAELFHEVLMSGDVSREALLVLVHALRKALDDPEQRELLEANGIDEQVVDRLERGLDDPSEFESEHWKHAVAGLFAAADMDLDEDGSGMPPGVRLMELELGIGLLEQRNLTDRQNALLDARSEVQFAIVRADAAGGSTELTQEEVDALRDSGMTADDTGSEKLKRILDGADPASESFTREELEAIGNELSAEIDNVGSLSATSAQDVVTLYDEIKRVYHMASESSAAAFSAQMKMVENIGSA